MPKPIAEPSIVPPPAPSRAGDRRWLLLVHQLPASPSNLRVRTWRRLQQLGAIPVKQAVYVLPNSTAAREDFEWLKTEIASAGGEASLFAADAIDQWSDDALVEEFRRVRQAAYGVLAAEIAAVVTTLSASRRRRTTRGPASGRRLASFRDRLAALERIDFFGSAGRDRVVAALGQLADAASRDRGPKTLAPSATTGDRAAYASRLWVTRPRPGVDRMSSAWLIRRFIDSQARFAFAADSDTLPSAAAVAFDMFGAEFSHQHGGCTFETLCRAFAIDDPAVVRLAAIVHHLDLKEPGDGPDEAGTVGLLVDGLQLATTDDELLLERGMALFEALYLAFAHTARAAGPRPVARPRSRPAAGQSSGGRRKTVR